MRNYFLLFAALLFICGIAMAAFGIFRFIPAAFFIIPAVILFVFIFLFLKRDFLFTTFITLLIILLGVIRYNAFNEIRQDNIKNFIFYSGEKLLVQGMVLSDPEEKGTKRRKTTFVLQVNSVKTKNSPRKTASGFVLASIYGMQKPAYKYGDILILEGSLVRPFSYTKETNFDYKEYLANKRIYSVLNVKKGFLTKKLGENEKVTTQARRFIYAIRARLESRIGTFLDPPYSEILSAILLGKRKGVPFDLKALFAKTGTLHILAISGLHVGIIYFTLIVVLKLLRFPRNPSIILSILFLICYAALTGSRPSILRAATMFSILGLGEILKRKISIFNLIGLSSLIILIANPNQAFDAGFILSYMAVLSIVCFSPIFNRILSVGKALERTVFLGKKIKQYLLRSVSVSLAAWVGLLPLLAYYFGLVTPVVVVANLVVIPLLSMVMASGILLVSLGLFSHALANIFAQSTWFFMFLMINGVKTLNKIPFSYFEINPPRITVVLLYYACLITIFGASKNKKLTFSFLT